jgi:5-methylcytosine-specific restriction enzyme A
MNSFLITFKPASENPRRGWPLQEIQRLAREHASGREVVENWRFLNRKDVLVGDRVFLLVQGKQGPAIIGYGGVAGEPEYSDGNWHVPVRFDDLVEPTNAVLADKPELLAINGGEKYWRIQGSGVLLPQSISEELENLVVGKPAHSAAYLSQSNPDWTRDELIVALNVYLRYEGNPPGKNSPEIVQLSRILNRLGEALFGQGRAATFRRLDPRFAAAGKKGLTRGAKAEETVWAEYAKDPQQCATVAEAIIASLDEPEVGRAVEKTEAEEDWIEEAPEGRLLTRKHFARERNRRLVRTKRKQALKQFGKLICEACGFDFAACYGERGEGFIECHHTKPVASLGTGQVTHIDDLALLCANCHRILHRARPWLTVIELQQLISLVGSPTLSRSTVG